MSTIPAIGSASPFDINNRVEHYKTGSTHLGDNLAKKYNVTPLTAWSPKGVRLASDVEQNHPVLPEGDHFITIHGGVRSTDEVNIVFAPVFEQTWNAESNAMVTESPVFGADGSSYFIPASPTDNGQNMLIKLAPNGERHFAVTRDLVGDEVITYPSGETRIFKATYGQGASPIVLNNPEIGKEAVYGATYFKAYAADEDGNILWTVSINPESILQALAYDSDEPLRETLAKPHRIFGITYHPAVDAILIADISGDVTALDRKTGKRLGGILMPGSPAAGGDNVKGSPDSGFSADQAKKIQDTITSVITDLFAQDGIELDASEGTQAAFKAVLGGGAVIGNQISVDPNTNSLWVASTDTDQADGTIDGVSELGALYRIDLTRSVNEGVDAVSFNFACSESFGGGTTSTPAVSADGLRVYTTDNFGSAIAIDRDCNRSWTLDVGEAAVASLAVSSEVGAEIYYPTLTTIYKIQENTARTSATIEWSADLNSSFIGGRLLNVANIILPALKNALEKISGIVIPDRAISLGAQNLDLASIGQNGIMIHSGYGLSINLNGTSILLPIALNNGLYDRKSGKFINGTNVLEENIGAMYTAPDGTIIMGSSPARRALVRFLAKSPDFFLPELPGPLEQSVDNVIDFLVKPLSGGVTKYGYSQGYEFIARDASCQAAKRIKNTIHYAPHTVESSGIKADISDTQRLILQSQRALKSAAKANELNDNTVKNSTKLLDQAHQALDDNNLHEAKLRLTQACTDIMGG